MGDKKFLLGVVVAGELEICGEGRAPCLLPVAADDKRGPSLQH